MNHPAASPELPRVLLAHADVAVTRLARESLEGFCCCTVDSTPDAVFAFERALQRAYRLFMFDLRLAVLDGPLLYELIAKASQYAQPPRPVPRVIYFCESGDLQRGDEWLRDARVQGLLATPLSIGKLLEKVGNLLEPRSGMGLP